MTAPATAPAQAAELCYGCFRPVQFCICGGGFSDALDWRGRAACRPGTGVDPDDFVPHGDGALGQQQVARAKAVCRGCAVAQACLADALRRGDDWAVLGGTTAAERRAGIREGIYPPPKTDAVAARKRLLARIAYYKAKGYSGAVLTRKVGCTRDQLTELLSARRSS